MEEISEGRFQMPEWLDGLLHLGLYNFLSEILGRWTPELTYSTLSILGGGVFVFLVLYLSSLLVRGGLERFFVCALVFSTASLELFFGYVESYTLFTLALVLYILLSVLHLQGKVKLFLPLLSLIFACSLHIFGLVFAPTFLYLWWRDLKRDKGFEFNPIHLLLIFILVLASILRIELVSFHTPDDVRARLIVPLFASPTNSFTMFSLDHILEFLNQLLLISPVAIALLIFFFSDIFRSKDKILNFLFLGTVFSVTFIFVFNSVLGSADWDLRSFPAVFYVPLGGLLFLRRAKEWRGYKNYSLFLIFVSFYHFIPWILLHTDEKRSVDHYELIQLADPHPQDEFNYNVFKITRTLEMAGLYAESEKVYKNAIKETPQDVRNYYNLARLYYNRFQSYSEAESLLLEIPKINPEYHLTYFLLGKIYQKRGDLRKALDYHLKSMPVLHHNVEFIQNLCSVYLELGKLPEFKKYLEEAVISKPESTEAHRNLGYVYFLMRDFERAKMEFEMALRLKPDDEFSLEYSERLKQIGY